MRRRSLWFFFIKTEFKLNQQPSNMKELFGINHSARESLTLMRYTLVFLISFTILAILPPSRGIAGTLVPQSGASAVLRVIVTDEAEKPVAGVKLDLKVKSAIVGSSLTNEKGEAEFAKAAPGTYEVIASKDGFESLTQNNLVITAGHPVESRFVMSPKIELKESVTIKASEAPPIEQGASPPTELQRSTVKNLPDRPATVADTLPLVPGVVRSPEGGLRIAGSGEHRSALIVNAADVTDPATGQFGLTVPVDSVETINVFKTPYLAQYGRFTAGIVSVETRRGGDKFNFELNDPLPEFRIRSGRLQGVREASPRFTFNGPIIPGKFYYSEGIEYDLEKIPVRTLPFPFNETKQQSLNSFTQLDYVLSPTHTVTGTFHLAPRHMSFVNLDFFNPQPVTPTFNAGDNTGMLQDRTTLGTNLLESTLALKFFHGDVYGQGQSDMVLTPTGNSGNYFSEQNRKASRIEWIEMYSLAPITVGRYGAHNLKFGSTVARTTNEGEFRARTIRIEDASARLLKQIDFVGGSPFDRSDLETGFFGQDHWVMNQSLSFDIGTRFERQGITETFRIAPRVGMAWAPFVGKQTVLRGGFGLFYDRVPLSVYSFDRYPEQSVTTFGPDGEIVDGPRLFANITDQAERSATPFVFGKNQIGNFAPYSSTWNIEVEHPVSRILRFKADYLQSNSSGVILVTPKVVQGKDALVLGGGGKSRYRQLELTARLSWKEAQEFFFSYVHSQSKGDLNEFNNYLGNFPFPVVRQDQFTNLPGAVPNRFLAWGVIQLPLKVRISPILEYRSGFPYAAVDSAQNYVGVANSDTTRYPSFYSLDTRISKDFQVSCKYALRLAVSGYNLTNHFNPISVHANIDDPASGVFFGSHKRRFKLDFDVIF